jgi:hypothetical protein
MSELRLNIFNAHFRYFLSSTLIDIHQSHSKKKEEGSQVVQAISAKTKSS